MRRTYKDWKPSAEGRDIVTQANAIVSEYRQQGYTLTLRQLYYQFVARAFIPNNMRSYKRLGTYVDRGRLAGMIDWSAIEDRTRNLAGGDSTTNDPAAVIRSFADYEDVAHWDDQPTHVEVWVEKEALAGVVERVAQRWYVPYFSCRGYVSQSEMHGAGRRLLSHLKAGRNVLILHLGDHDPSGIDMTRDITERLENFVSTDWLYEMMPSVESATNREIHRSIIDHLGSDTTEGRFGIEVRRIALNWDQVEEHGPPPNPAKLTDSRAEGYIERFGRESWELDALPPDTLADLIIEGIQPVIDFDLWNAKEAERQELRDQYMAVADNWSEIQQEYR